MITGMNIPERRELYGRRCFEDNSSGESNVTIDYDKLATKRLLHTMVTASAVQITAENTEAEFKPTSGGIQELNFRSTPSIWVYFSLDSSGSIHGS